MKTTVLAAAITLISATAMAQPDPGQGMRMRIIDELNLTDQQKQEVEKIHTEASRQGIDRRAEIAKARVDLRQLLRADKPDQTAIQKKLNDIAALRSTSAQHQVQTWFSINKLLTPEQQKIWKNGLERRSDRGGRMMRGKRGMRDGQGRDGGGRNFDGPRGFRNRGPF